MTFAVDCFYCNSAGRREVEVEREGRAVSNSIRRRTHSSTVHLCERVSNREPEPQTSMPSRSRTVCLTKTIKHMRQKCCLNSDTCIHHLKNCLLAVKPCGDADLATGIGKLDRVGYKIPRNLL